MYKILTGREDVDRGKLFTMGSEASRATTSTAHDLNARVKHGRLDFSARSSGQWNEIPCHIKDMRTVEGFAFKAAYGRHRQNIAQRG